MSCGKIAELRLSVCCTDPKLPGSSSQRDRDSSGPCGSCNKLEEPHYIDSLLSGMIQKHESERESGLKLNEIKKREWEINGMV